MQNIPHKTFKQIQQAIQRPVGTFTFTFESEGMFDKNKPGGKILEIPAGGHLFRLERTDDLKIRYYHSSPGTETRVADIDLNKVKKADKLFMAFSWSPEEIKLNVGPRIKGGKLHTSIGKKSDVQFQVGEDESVFQLGDKGVDVMGANMYRNGNPVLLPPALDVWRQTITAANLLKSGESEEGFIYEVAISNVILSVLVTGFETYTKTRFLELEKEGISPDNELLIEKFTSKREREANYFQILREEAKEKDKTVLKHIVDKDIINFQNYSNCKKAYNKAYNLKFGEIGVDSTALETLQNFIKYRHRVIHISPLVTILNQYEVPKSDPVFSNKELAQEAIDCFDNFISSLHEATLELTPND